MQQALTAMFAYGAGPADDHGSVPAPPATVTSLNVSAPSASTASTIV